MKKVILFAGAVGSGKTPISNYLSYKLNLPIYNNDAIRSEVIEDLWELDSQEHIKRRDQRLKELLNSNISFIADFSIDRIRDSFKEELKQRKYQRYLISIDLSKDFLTQLYQNKKYTESLLLLNQIFEDHEKFLKKYKNDVNLSINNDNFKERLELAYQGAKQYLQD